MPRGFARDAAVALLFSHKFKLNLGNIKMAFVRAEVRGPIVNPCLTTRLVVNLLEFVVSDASQTNADRRLADEIQVWCLMNSDRYDYADILARPEMRRLLALGFALHSNSMDVKCQLDSLTIL